MTGGRRAPRRWPFRWPVGERGSVAVEAAVVAPALVALLLVVVLAGRVTQADGDVRRAAAAAARAASLHRYADGAEVAARDAAEANLATSGVACGHLDTAVDTSAFGAGGAVVVTLRCTSSLHDVAALGVPGQMTFEARSAAVIDRYRGGDE